MSDLIDITAPADSQEGTTAVLKSWLKNVGDAVAEHDPVAELETDKVAVEVAAPKGGVIVELVGEIDAEVAPGAVLARLDPNRKAAPAAESKAPDVAPAARATQTVTSGREDRLSPSVRRLVGEHGLDAAAITGTGAGGRLTRQDVLDHVAKDGAPTSAANGRLIPLDSMRRRIAEHMVRSVSEAPHVTALFEADFSAVMADRKTRKPEFAGRGVNLTYTAYIVRACVEAMRAVPQVNSRLHEDAVEIFEDVNIGVGTALGDKGLIVPVVHKAQTLDLFETAKALEDLTTRAKDGTLKPEDVKGGTFSVSNHGVSGSLLATPIIINQPQSAILGVGKLEKRAVVREAAGEDVVVIRPMAYVTLTIDHRVLDGFQTNAWLTRFVEALEHGF